MTRFEVVFVSLVALLLGLILLVVGVAFAVSPYYALPLHALQVFGMKPLLGGTVLAFIGFSLLLSFFSLTKRRFLRFRTSGYSISEDVLADLARRSLCTLYPNASCEVIVRRGKQLELTTNISVSEEELEKVEALLQETFAKSCGFTDSFRLNFTNIISSAHQ